MLIYFGKLKYLNLTPADLYNEWFWWWGYNLKNPEMLRDWYIGIAYLLTPVINGMHWWGETLFT